MSHATQPVVQVLFDHFPPPDNHSYIITRRGTMRRPDHRAIEFYDLVDRWARSQGRPRISGHVVILKWIVWPDRVRRDPANLNKVLCDAFVKAGVIEDDCRALVRDMFVARWPVDRRAAMPGGFPVPLDDTTDFLDTEASTTEPFTFKEPGLLVRIRAARPEQEFAGDWEKPAR